MGLVAHCVELRAIGVDRDGGLAPLVAVPERQAYEVPPDLPSGFGALCEPLACCLRASDLAAVRPGESVAVIGGGVIGQLLSQLARLAGGKVILVTRQPERRALAESLGASASIDPAAAEVAQAISGPSGLAPGGVDVAFEAAGVEDTFHQAIAVVRRAGRVVVVGAAPSSMRVPISPFELGRARGRCHGLVPQPAHPRTSCPTSCFGRNRPPGADHEDDRPQRCPRRAQSPPRPGRDQGPEW